MKKHLSLVLAFILSMSLLLVPSMAAEDIPEEIQGSDESVVCQRKIWQRLKMYRSTIQR